MRTNRLWRSFRQFSKDNYRLLFLFLLYFIGLIIGARLYSPDNAALNAQLSAMLGDLHRLGTVSEAASELAVSCMLPMVLLLLCGVSGLSVCGAPVALFCTAVYGISLGLTEAYLYADGLSGVLITLLHVLPHSLICLAAVLMAASESLRMSVLLCRKLFPDGAGGNLSNEFHLFGVRYLVFFLLAVVGGLVDVGCRLLFGRLTALL